MNASVLIVGDDEFTKRLFQEVRGLSAITRWQVKSANEATTLLESEVPDIALLQAAQPDNWELCRTLKQQRHLMWSYSILLDERPCPAANAAADVLLRQTGLTTTALETGADAYLWVPKTLVPEKQAPINYLNRLIQAHIRAAMRRIHSHKELSQKNDLLSAIALADPLTRLGNRRAFDWELPRQVKMAREQEHPLSLLLLDIDYFKRINDDYGHLVGDEVLRMFSERLRHHMRFYETPFRYGGEEFVVLLQNTSPREAKQTGERLRKLINDRPFLIDNGLALPLTVSIGVSTLESADDASGLGLIARADSNLLTAKTSGRNRVIVG